ncbi:hypothetical protein Enr13x_49950 [Stieleria neptunia]|uniref:Uncharacterized protein n=1 Tax=Stieleria neptunia TaxID=2527979 RepID=A0A518HWA6_9BACT|nr:hypothetical protein Enr13x_49950 [Stieleria neptunia]
MGEGFSHLVRLVVRKTKKNAHQLRTDPGRLAHSLWGGSKDWVVKKWQGLGGFACKAGCIS